MRQGLFLRYLTGSKKYWFEFNYVNLPDGTWRAYIISTPSYKDRDRDMHITHRLSDSNGDDFVCWTEPLSSLEDCKYVSAVWAECTEKYIDYGTKF